MPIEENPQLLIALTALVTGALVVQVVAGNRVKQHVRLRFAQGAPLRAATDAVMTSRDALMFPVIGSCVLLGLYMLVKYAPEALVRALIAGYMTFISIIGFANALRPFLGASVPLGIACCGLGGVYLYTKHWTLNNLFAMALSITAVEAIPIQSFAVSALLLVLLFFYDIFWVFGTDVMVTVATKIDGPIKLLFPQAILSDDHSRKSLLGLGDIVLPGIFIMHMLRLSLLRSGGHSTFYFRVAMGAYVLSLLNTMAVMIIFDHAQPALLYIVPWLLLTALGSATMRGELGAVITFDEEVADKQRVAEAGAASSSPVRAETKEEDGFFKVLAQQTLSVFGLDEEWKTECAKQSAKKVL